MDTETDFKKSFAQTLIFNPYIFPTQYYRPWIFPNINTVYRSNHPTLKYQRFTPSGYANIRFRQFEFVKKTHFLYLFRR